MNDPLREALVACVRDAVPANVAVARMIALAPSRAAIGAAIDTALAAGLTAAPVEADAPITAIARCWRENEAAYDTLRAVLDAADHDRGGGDPARWGEVFDRIAGVAPDAGAAVYALLRPETLAAATASIVARFDAWGLLAPGARVADLGCGAGRMLAALAPRVAEITGIDVSPGMVRAAGARTAKCANVRLVHSPQGDLGGFADGAFDLVIAVDVFPYITACGSDDVARAFAGCRRVLAPAGSLVILNFAYGRGFEAERRAVGDLAARFGLTLRRAAERDFDLWDGTTFVLQRS